MKAHYRALNGKITFECEGDSPKSLFKKLALVQEIFDADSQCGACKSLSIKFRTRQVEDYEFFEMVCTECYARLEFGQHKKGGTLFPKRKDADNNYLPDRGWTKYEKKTDSEPPPQRHRSDEIGLEDVPF